MYSWEKERVITIAHQDARVDVPATAGELEWRLE
jgi:hypothetical protein